MKKNILFALLLVASGFAGCNKADTPANPEQGNGIAPGGCYPPNQNCAAVLCTAHFADVQLEVRNSSGGAVALDAFVVTDLSGTPLPPSNGTPVYGYPQSGSGVYSVINDAWLAGHQNSSASVRAKGFIKGLLVFDEAFTITADCCHVGKISGKDVVIVP